jgi:Na+:H+ antiporter, NhaA family
MKKNIKDQSIKLTNLFNEFFNSEKSAGLILLFCSAVSIVLANSFLGNGYIHFWHTEVVSKPIEFWINDGLMTIFFLLVGLEIEREIYIGELSDIKKSLLPVFAALGGMVLPALIHFIFNQGTVFQRGFGIPMATDIAFSLGILSLLGSRVPATLKVFLTALAIIDDLGAIVIIAIFYSTSFSIIYFGSGVLVFGLMIALNRAKFYKTWVYLILGGVLWICLYQTGIHPTITGVLLAFAIPFGSGDENSPSYNLQHRLHKIVAFFILPIFALANTAILIPASFTESVLNPNSYGIILGLIIGKPLGIFLFSLASVILGLSIIPDDINKKHLFGVGLLAGIGFTMSIFITLLAFSDNTSIVNSKISVLIASLSAGLLGFIWLYFTLPKNNITKGDV